jgi:competence protein ComEC
MEVYFLDVGQGTSHLILLGNRQAIVVDAGPKTDSILFQAIARYSVERLVRFVTTHSHSDHVGGAERILSTYTDSIDELWFLDDPQLRKSRFFRRIRQLVDDKELLPSQLRRIERDSLPREIYADDSSDLRLTILSPDFATNLAAIDDGDPNKTAAIIVLQVGSVRIVFGSDSWFEQWKAIHAERNRPLNCDILAVPHHGGNMGQSADEGFRLLYGDIIRAKNAIISVGTRNTFGHPKPIVVDALRQSGATVICTQITDKCCHNLEAVRRGLLSPLEPVRQSLATKKMNASYKSQRVACAGTVVADISNDRVAIRNLLSHQGGIDALAKEPFGCPICRTNSFKQT